MVAVPQELRAIPCWRAAWADMKRKKKTSRDQRTATQRHPYGVKRRDLLLGGLTIPSAATLMAACSQGRSPGPDATSENLRIGFVGSVLNNPFWAQMQKGATAASQELAGVDLTYTAPEEFSLANINELIKAVIAARPDGIAVDYRGREFEEVTGQALDQGIAVQFFNNFKGLDSADPRIVQLSRTAVGLDKLQAARTSGEAFLKHLEHNTPVVLFNGLPDAPEHLVIQNAYLRVFSEAGWDRELIEVFPVGLDPAQNFQLMKIYLAAHPRTRGIVCWDSPTGSAAARAKADSGLDIPILSWNLDPIILQSLRDGSLTLTLSQQPFLQGYYAVVALYLKLKHGLTDPPFVDPGVFLIDRTNVGEVEKLFRKGVLG